MSEKVQNFADQDFETLRQKCLSVGLAFKDAKFPPDDKSFKWIRPKEICRDPEFYVKGSSNFDVYNASVRDSCLISAIANLTLNEKLFNQVVCMDNGNFDENYSGIFHFRFWRYGKWIDVVIDDRLPTKNRKLVFAQSAEKNEFWSALLEKAYAKLYGGYKAINGVNLSETYVDLTGGVTEIYDLHNPHEKLFRFILKSSSRNALLSASILASNNLGSIFGLVSGHAYSITKIITLHNIDSVKHVKLLRLRNPWGQGEWCGPWSKRSYMWQSISSKKKLEIGLTIEHNGEFWISYEDFLKYFDTIVICNLTSEVRNSKLTTISFEGNFKTRQNYHEIFLTEPDYCEEFCTIVVALMQKNSRKINPLGFKIFSLNGYKKNFVTKTLKPIIPTREVCHRFELLPGRYLIEPFSFTKCDKDYLLRVHCATSLNAKHEEHKSTVSHKQKTCCCAIV